jgi:hypothetical protein
MTPFRSRSDVSWRLQFAIEFALVLVVSVAALYTLTVSPGAPATRPWLLPLAVGTIVAGILGLILRTRGRGRLAGALYCIAAAAPNGLYVFNLLLLAVGIAALAGVRINKSGQSGGSGGASRTEVEN